MFHARTLSSRTFECSPRTAGNGVTYRGFWGAAAAWDRHIPKVRLWPVQHSAGNHFEMCYPLVRLDTKWGAHIQIVAFFQFWNPNIIYSISLSSVATVLNYLPAGLAFSAILVPDYHWCAYQGETSSELGDKLLFLLQLLTSRKCLNSIITHISSSCLVMFILDEVLWSFLDVCVKYS